RVLSSTRPGNQRSRGVAVGGREARPPARLARMDSAVLRPASGAPSAALRRARGRLAGHWRVGRSRRPGPNVDAVRPAAALRAGAQCEGGGRRGPVLGGPAETSTARLCQRSGDGAGALGAADLNLSRIVASTVRDNIASIAVMRRIGMTIEEN